MYRKAALSNGLRIISQTMPHVRSASIVVFVGAGSRHERAEQAGVFHFLEHLCFKGTEKRASTREISNAIEGVGGIINAGTGKEMTTYWSKVATPHFGLAMDVLSDIVRHSRFDSSDIDMERNVVIEEINMGWDSPQQRVYTLADELLWPDHPLGRDGVGNRESVSALTRGDVLESFGQQYRPNNTVVSVAGNIEHEEVVERVAAAFGDWQAGGLPQCTPALDGQEKPRVCIEARDIEQAHVCLAVKGLPLGHPQRLAMDVMSIILGESMSSRLFTEIREKRGLAYAIYSCSDHFMDAGALSIYAGVTPRQVPTATEAIFEQLVKLKRHGVSQAELDQARDLIKGRMLLRLEDTYNVAGWLGGQELLLRKVLTAEDTGARIDKIGIEDIRQVANELLVTEKLNLAVVGPPVDEATIEGLLEL